MKSFLNGFTRGEVDRNVTPIPYGIQAVKVVKVWATDSHHKDSSETNLKTEDEIGEWKDATPQLAVTFQGITPEGKPNGIVTHRFQGHGYVRYGELEERGLNPDDYFSAGPEGYAVHETTETRVVDEFRTKQAENIVNELLDACGIPEGTEFASEDDWKVQLMGKQLKVEVYARTYEGKDSPRVKNFKPLEVKVEEAVATEE